MIRLAAQRSLLGCDALRARIPESWMSRSRGFCGGRRIMWGVEYSGRWSSSLGDGGVQYSRVQAPSSLAPVVMDAEALEGRYGRPGVKFKEAVGYSIVELKLDDRSSARIVLQTAVVTSWKTLMWHGGLEELLHTQVVEGAEDGRPTMAGGVALSVAEAAGRESLLATVECWELEDVTSFPAQYVQVTLSTILNTDSTKSTSSSPELHLKYVITLAQGSLSCALMISNMGNAPASLHGSLQTSIGVNYVDGALVIGLEGCTYLSKPPKQSTNASRQHLEDSDTQNTRVQAGLFSNLQRFWGMKKVKEPTRSSSGAIVEKEEYTGLHGGIDRLYTMAPDSISLLDRGKRRALDFCSFGFEDIRLSNPGEESGLETWDSFVCVGLEQSTRPVLIQPGQEWRAALQLENPSQ